ncbi:MAG: aminotransferase class V-fold PLP-dependent enzyme [Planctomycetota bacterium]
MLDLEFVRSRFPTLAATPEWSLFDNAGGSVPLGSVVDAVQRHMLGHMVQLGASYELSERATDGVAAGHRAAEELFGSGADDVVVGTSSTALTKLVASAFRPLWQEGDEIIVTDLDHEANIGAWRALEASGIRVREWQCDPETYELRVADLKLLLNDRTRLVACTHCSNLVGEIQDVAAIAEAVHAAGALLYVDGVALAPHRRVDMATCGADLYVASLYKVYGPHLSALHVGKELLQKLASQNHFFIGDDEGPYKLQPGMVPHELCASLPAIPAYLKELDLHHGGGGTLDGAFAHITEHESLLVEPLLKFLADHPRVRLLGRAVADARRAPTVAFVPLEQPASTIPPRMDEQKVAVRWGHFYAHRFCTRFGLHDNDGVVRASMVHYNSPGEVQRLIEALDAIL